MFDYVIESRQEGIPVVAAYLRVSTDKQTVLNQKSEVLKFCRRQDLEITLWCMETVSGTKKEDERELGILLHKLQQDDVLIVTEVSRLSRKMVNIINIIHQSIERGITIYSIKEGYRFDSSINSQVLAFAFGLCAEIERTLISQRTGEALARRKAQGVVLGRPKGSMGISKLSPFEEEISLPSRRKSRSFAGRGCHSTKLPTAMASRLRLPATFTSAVSSKTAGSVATGGGSLPPA